jgi:hypothetical protein
MATVQTRPYLAGSADIKLEYGVAQTFALKFASGKSIESRFPGGRVMFTAIDDRKLFLNDEDASDLERGMRELGIGVADFARVTKIRHARGGGHSIRVERAAADDAPAWVRDILPAWVRDAATAPASRLESDLERSVEMARTHGAAAFHSRPAEAPAAPVFPVGTAEAPARTASHQLMSAFCAAIDAVSAAQTYANGKGLHVTFTSEDIRCVAISAFIQAEKAAMGARY